jgi:hypothetical protein
LADKKMSYFFGEISVGVLKNLLCMPWKFLQLKLAKFMDKTGYSRINGCSGNGKVKASLYHFYINSWLFQQIKKIPDILETTVI